MLGETDADDVLDTNSTDVPAPPPPEEDGSFWTRVMDAFASESAAKSAQDAAESAAPIPAPPPAISTETGPEEAARRERLLRMSEEQSAGLALVVGKKVEKVLVEKLETREASLQKVAHGFVELSSVLKGLGQSLVSQDERARALESAIALGHEAEQEQSRELAGISSALGEQTARQRRVVELLESVPEVVSLVKQGQAASQVQLQAIAQVQQELLLQRDERERVALGVASVERVLVGLGEQLQGLSLTAARVSEAVSAQSARDEQNAAKLEAAVSNVCATIERSTRAESERFESQQATTVEKADRFERALTRLAVRVKDQSQAIIQSQEGAATTFQRSQHEVFETFEKAQARALEALERLHQERARETARAWGRMMAGGAVFASVCVGLVLFMVVSFVRAERQRVQAEIAAEQAVHAEAASAVVPTRAPSGVTTLPAGMPR
jgi:hypothetical protein